jgi:putative selenate reductase
MKSMKSFCGGPGGGFLEKSPLAAGGKSNFILDKKLSLADYQQKSAKRIYGEDPQEINEKNAQKEAQRCLFCGDICNVCVTVCPNRANVSYTVEPMEYLLQKAINRDGKIEIIEDKPFRLTQSYQVINIADFCNECGNCRTFCPTAGAPYKDKPKICLTEESFRAEPNGFFIGVCYDNEFSAEGDENNQKLLQGVPDASRDGFLEKSPPGRRWVIKSKKENGDMETLFLEKNQYIYETACISATLDKNTLRVKDIRFKPSSPVKEVNFKRAAEMSILLTALGHWYGKGAAPPTHSRSARWRSPGSVISNACFSCKFL